MSSPRIWPRTSTLAPPVWFHQAAAALEPPACPSECVAFSDTVQGDTVRECQAKQVAAFVEAQHKVPEPAIISGDFNAAFDSPTYNEFTDRGWLDSHLEAGNPECDPMTGENCTAGRVNDDLRDLESPDLNQTERIDFIFVVPPRGRLEMPGRDPDLRPPRGDEHGPLRRSAQPLHAACGPPPRPICWPSDHSGNALNLSCQPLTDMAVHR